MTLYQSIEGTDIHTLHIIVSEYFDVKNAALNDAAQSTDGLMTQYYALIEINMDATHENIVVLYRKTDEQYETCIPVSILNADPQHALPMTVSDWLQHCI